MKRGGIQVSMAGVFLLIFSSHYCRRRGALVAIFLKVLFWFSEEFVFRFGLFFVMLKKQYLGVV